MVYRLLLLSALLILPGSFAESQNITPRPTPLSTNRVEVPGPTPTPVFRLGIPVQRIRGARLEVIAGERVVFSETSRVDADNVRLYYWEPGAEDLLDTEEDGLAGTVKTDEDGRFIVFLYNELRGRDINGDGSSQYVLRLYHFETRQIANFPLPAQTRQDASMEDWENFEYEIENGYLVYSVSSRPVNTREEDEADWYIVQLDNLFSVLIGTPTPTPTPTPDASIPTPTPVPPQPTPQFVPADMNEDGSVNALDLLFFQRFWRLR